MEYVRHRFIIDDIHFHHFVHQITFFIPQDIGPFDLIRLKAMQYLELFLDRLNLIKAKVGPYDPHGIISKHIIENRNSSYELTKGIFVEFANL